MWCVGSTAISWRGSSRGSTRHGCEPTSTRPRADAAWLSPRSDIGNGVTAPPPIAADRRLGVTIRTWSLTRRGRPSRAGGPCWRLEIFALQRLGVEGDEVVRRRRQRLYLV